MEKPKWKEVVDFELRRCLSVTNHFETVIRYLQQCLKAVPMEDIQISEFAPPAPGFDEVWSVWVDGKRVANLLIEVTNNGCVKYTEGRFVYRFNILK